MTVCNNYKVWICGLSFNVLIKKCMKFMKKRL
jgi:hypothetical protein